MRKTPPATYDAYTPQVRQEWVRAYSDHPANVRQRNRLLGDLAAVERSFNGIEDTQPERLDVEQLLTPKNAREWALLLVKATGWLVVLWAALFILLAAANMAAQSTGWINAHF